MNVEPDPAFAFALPSDPAHRDRLAEVGQLASGLVHELKNPLGAISLTVEMLLAQARQGSLDPERSVRRLERIADGTRELSNIITSFLAFARPERAEYDLIDINQLLANLLDELADGFAKDIIRCERKFNPRLNAIAADRNHLLSIFRNVLLNAMEALQARSSDRRILVVTRNSSRSVRIMIANNGPPLNDQAAAHLFDPFYSSKEGGTGLGLAIVKRLIEIHHGRITVASTTEQGVSFTIEFPTSFGPATHLDELPVPTRAAEIIDEA